MDALDKKKKRNGSSKEVKKSGVCRLKRQRKAANRRKWLCQWTDKQMRRAMEAVMKGELGVNRSALEHGVPKDNIERPTHWSSKTRHQARTSGLS